ncbi:hypothetical protein [Pedobacter sp. JY14-1]|uniref:hypothetical protein n=1 Tax=Pedobacter sp. JY14-1 TaxID=3034151 RepID=UPI0023E1B525|nr:hypothetical protein [Pedobacter sp. JY14-1]
MEQFRIEAANDGKGVFFDVKPLGDQRYELYDQGAYVGTLSLDQDDHSSCKAEHCKLDLPLLDSIRQVIQVHEQWTPKPAH